MNKIILLGRLTKNPETQILSNVSNTVVSRYSLAVDKKYRREDGITADFFNIVAFGRNAEFAEKYFRKGTKIAITGRIQTGSYTNKDGVKVYTTDVVVEEQEFAESKNSSGADGGFGGGMSRPEPSGAGDGFMNIPDGIDEELPFN